jgi:hypothetical protein
VVRGEATRRAAATIASVITVAVFGLTIMIVDSAAIIPKRYTVSDVSAVVGG